MYRATTPTHTFKLPIEADTCSIIRVTYKQGQNKLKKEKNSGETSDGMTIDGRNVTVVLTQEETLQFEEGKTVTIQLRALTNAGAAFQSQKWRLPVEGALDEEVLE